MLKLIILILLNIQFVNADAQNTERGRPAVESESTSMAGKFGFMAFVGSSGDIINFFDSLTLDSGQTPSVEYTIHRTQISALNTLFIEIVTGTLTREELEEIQLKYDQYVREHILSETSSIDLNVAGRWGIIEENVNIFDTDLGSRQSESFSHSFLGLEFHNGLLAPVADEISLFVSAGDDPVALAVQESPIHQRLDKEGRPISNPLNAHTEIGVREGRRTYSLRNAFIVQPNHHFSIQSPTDVSVSYRGLYFYFTQEL